MFFLKNIELSYRSENIIDRVRTDSSREDHI